MSETATAPVNGLKMCKIVVVEPGIPNHGIRVYPAEHEFERVDITHRPGQERWEFIQQTIQRFSEPGKHIPKPLSFNPDHPKNTWNPAPSDDQLPLVNLVGYTLKPLPEQVRPRMSNPQQNQKETGDRLDRLEAKLEKLTDALLNQRQSITTAIPDQVNEPKRRGRPKKESPSEA